MKHVEALLSQLSNQDINLWLEEGRLRYNAPKGKMTAELKAEIGTHKADIIQFLQHVTRNVPAPASAEQPIPLLSRDAPLPLSFAQQRLWFLNQLEKGNAATYNMPPSVIKITGALNVEALQQALAEIMQRHEVLRASFSVDHAGATVQTVQAQVALDMPLIDLQHLDDTAQHAELQRLTREQAGLVFDLRQAPLLRLLLLKFAPTEHVFMLTMHHIISDGWSIGVFVQELSALYNAFYQGLPSPLPPLAIQYADFAAWQQQRLSGDFLQQLKDYWQNQLRGAPALIELPTDRPRRPVQRYHGETEYFYLSREQTQQLHQLSQRHGVTVFMTLFAVYATLLHRYTRQADLVIGSPIANRTHSQLEPLIGFFINTLALRVDFSQNPTFSELLQQVKQTALAAYTHQELPFEKLVETLQPERSLSYSPIFQVLFVLQNAPVEEAQLAGLTISPLPTENINAIYDLILSMEELSSGLEGKVRYNIDLFDKPTIQRFISHFQTLVTGLLAEPECRISRLPLLTPNDSQQLTRWNETAQPYRQNVCLHTLIEEQVARTPDAVALRFENQQLSYRELNARANQLAYLLRERGIQPDQFVGICLERSLEMVVGLLGIIKAGAAYVPIDPDYPAARVEFMLEDSQVTVLLTQSQCLLSLPAVQAMAQQADKTVLCLDTASAELARFSTDNPPLINTPKQLAYMIYTSGSTGKPKGAMNPHRAIVNRLQWMQEAYQIDSSDVVLQKTPFSFDVSVWEFFWPLLTGASLTLAKAGGHRDPDYLAQLIADAGVTTLHFVPSMLQIFLQQNDLAQRCPSLKQVMCSGEALPFELQERFFACLPQVKLHNLYGPTEAAVDVTHWTCRSDSGLSQVPIGYPIANIQIHILDAELQPVPIGVAGELHIGGIGVARGYFNRPELTAEKFIADPFSSDPEARLYKTGDLARFRPEGWIEYLGRLDNQIKLRGFRIELGEIEAALVQHPAVQESVVIGWKERADMPPRLVSYLGVKAADKPSPSELRQFLHDKLPEYMVPSMFIVLDALPLSPNGKVDRHALPAPETVETKVETPYVAPSSEIEQLLAELWREILGVAQVGLNDDFFELGGDSIKGAIFINRLQEQLKKIIYVVALFEAPTIAKFVTYLGEHYPEVLAENDAAANSLPTLSADDFTAFQATIPPLDICKTQPPKNPRAIFVLAPPRSGTTLMRVVLGGNSRLFAPPELELLSFNDMQERAALYSGSRAYVKEGLTRAVMAALDCDADRATQLMADFEAQNLSIQAVYRQLQTWIGDKILVDKSPSYPLDIKVLEHAEAMFEDALYIHLVRHPYGMIHSFEEAKLHQVFFHYPHNFAPRHLAELIWLQSQRNIQTFLQNVPAERQIQVKFEDLTTQPEPTVRSLCDFLGLEFDPAMLRPQEDAKQRMTDGVHAVSKMLGDAKFHTHQGINAQTAERWKQTYQQDFLGADSWHTAASLGYETPAPEVATLTELAKQPRPENLPLSFAQNRLWFLAQLEGASATYNMPAALRLSGQLSVSALEHSLQTLVQRHESLRTCFPTVKGEPQVCITHLNFQLAQVDLRNQSEAARQAAVEAAIQSELTQAFDIEQAPLFRAKLLSLSTDEHVLLLNMHHIISDGWSVGILIRECSALYQAFSQQQANPLPPLRIQYADFANWQRQWLRGDTLSRQLNYWKQQLADLPAVLELPTDYPRPPMQSFRGANAYFSLDAGLSQQLKQYSQQHGATLFMTLWAAYSVLLARYSGQSDIVVGSPIAGRTQQELESLIGFFVNTLVLRLNLAQTEQPRFSEVLQQARKVALAAYQHQDIPFEQLVEELRPTRNLSHSPLFQVMFVLQNAPNTAVELEGLSITPLEANAVIAKFDLTLSMEETEAGLSGRVEYNTDLFKASTIERLIGHWKTLLQAIVSQADCRVADLPLLTLPEQQQLQAWNAATVRPYPLDQATTLSLFEQQAARTPDAVAVTLAESGDSISYAALNAKANELAQVISSLGVTRESLVGVCVERGFEMLISLFAVFKAGAAYVPIDPEFPPNRLQLMLEDSGAPLLLTQTSLLDRLPAHEAKVLCLDKPWPKPMQAQNLSAVTPEQLAYVIYTSGSTGKPKGVMIEHRALTNFLLDMQERLTPQASDAWLTVTTLSFDIAALELFLPLISGASVVVANRETATDGERLQHALQQRAISIMQATPATWKLLLNSGWQQQTPLTVLCGGEALPPALGQALLPQCQQLWNVYGPTETTIWSTAHDASHAERVDLIGKPLANTDIFILDAQQQPVPVGISGELCIGGAGVARGYRNRPELNAEKFTELTVFGKTQRVYRTGDAARWLDDGVLEFFGRMDNQVKVRGFRIELGEIESVIAQAPAVREGVVVVHDDGEDKRLVAYLLLHDTAADWMGEVREFLKPRLPSYMIPTALLAVDSFPLTPNGKIDRKVLAQRPVEGYQADRTHFIAPRDRVELQLSRIWELVLNVHPIGVCDNFFDLGGHSLLAVRLMAQIEQQFHKRLPLASLFQGATIEQQAKLLRETQTEQWSSLVPLQTEGNLPPFFAVAGAGGHVLYFYELARALGNELPFYGLQPVGLDGETPPHTEVEALAAHYIEVIKTVQPHGPYHLGGHSFGGMVAFEMAQQLQRQGETVALLAILDTPAPQADAPPSPQADWDDVEWLIHLAHITEHLFDIRLTLDLDSLRELPADAQLLALHNALKQAQVYPPEASIKQFKGLVAVYKANIMTRYFPQSVQCVPLTLFRAKDAQPEQLAAPENQNAALLANENLGWAALLGTAVEVKTVSGDHLTMLNPPHVGELAEVLRGCW